MRDGDGDERRGISTHREGERDLEHLEREKKAIKILNRTERQNRRRLGESNRDPSPRRRPRCRHVSKWDWRKKNDSGASFDPGYTVSILCGKHSVPRFDLLRSYTWSSIVFYASNQTGDLAAQWEMNGCYGFFALWDQNRESIF